MEKGKLKSRQKHYSVVMVPHFSDSVRTVRLPSVYLKLAVLLIASLITVLAVYIVTRELNVRTASADNQSLRNAIQELQNSNKEQTELLEEKAREIEDLKKKEASINEKVDEFLEKYKSITDKYINNRIESSRSGASSPRSSSFTKDLKDLREVLASLDKLAGEETSAASLQDTEGKLKKYLDSVPTLWPVEGRISSNFGKRRDPITGHTAYHEGLDIAADYGEDIRAAAAGTVTHCGTYKALGRAVIISHGHSLETIYGHTSRILVKEGQKVKKGQIIARVGSSGRSTGPHLHFQVQIGDTPVNPTKYLD